jgi:CHAT domain-containing protein
VDLGPAEPIERAVEELRRSLTEVRPDVRERARDLDVLTTAKIRPLLADAKDLILSPDGTLQLVPFAALVDEEGRYLVERYNLHYVTSGRDLLRSGDVEGSREAGLLLGDADFDAPLGPREGNGEAKRSASIGSLHLERIAGTGEEVRAIGDLLGLPQERIVTGTAATEQAVKRVRGPEILHIASHGFFLPDLPASEGTGPVDLQFPRPVPEEPLLRSGLALSGFNRHLQSQSPDDGILTALEVADLDLWGTGLVVLSACETGLGDVRTGQGVFGLRRALALAGSQSQMMSLWQVPDEGTRDLMISWYGQMQRGVPKAAALRSIQLAALAGQPLPQTGVPLHTRGARPEPASDVRLEGSRHPYYWAGWILSGDPGPLRMKQAAR